MVGPPSNSASPVSVPWKMGYAALATLLLTLWIGLNRMTEDQTGVRFQKGMETWRSRQGRWGLPPGYWSGQEPSPEPTAAAPSPKEEGDPKELAAKHRAQLAGFVADIGLRFKSEKKPRVLGQFVIDVLDPIAATKPHLLPSHHEALVPAIPFFKEKIYRISVITWATSPGTSAWLRAQQNAQKIAAELLEVAGSSSKAELQVFAQPWAHTDQVRPAFSLVLAKVATVSAPQE